MTKKCPKCGSNVKTVCTKGNRRKYECLDEEWVDCDWESKPFRPRKKPVSVEKTIGIGCWEYQAFDSRGQPYCYSEGFDSKQACLKAARKDIERQSKNPDYGKCTAVIWPPSVVVKGELVEIED